MLIAGVAFRKMFKLVFSGIVLVADSAYAGTAQIQVRHLILTMMSISSPGTDDDATTALLALTWHPEFDDCALGAASLRLAHVIMGTTSVLIMDDFRYEAQLLLNVPWPEIVGGLLNPAK